MKFFLIAGAVNALISVGMGAFGAHGLEGKVSDHYIAIWETAAKYQMYHAIGLILIGILQSRALLGAASQLNWAGWLMLAGILLFSGSLYVLALTQIGVLGAITPIGGVAFMAGWIMVILAAVKHV
ncbi:DUF423 domain-containing protein [Bhargavaea beijingensis]|uniref:DUF423 domain-containing protein n=1 Tax=Bhargavaea beijingensis TaxID=426756 RepID=A0A1G7DQB2_9BACL|nr:DUF423 domain-containing protein [Bhargavaea beijingensis]MCW1928945.1 DUF423 domain-containing protein [Bhargavaea beijingensis]RSK30021.1 DUF423 domain-containing protein [Bhargavaea beijingensis]SDE53708.1 Uncharacterized membrane protein YgdD, TMEM256/DUF423 family [Bhargavaea beijingensis]